METEIGGNAFKGCVNVNAQTGNIARTFNQQICWVDPVTTVGTPPPPSDCDTDGDGTLDAVKATGWQGGDCETPVSPLTLCNAVADCPNALNLCQSAQAGTCSATAGTCS